MKNNYFLFPALALALASCSQTDEPGQLTEHSPASFTAQIGQTVSRAAGTDWFAGDAIGISGISGSKTYRNVKFVTASGDGNFTSEVDNIYYQTTDPVTFTAYYPYATNLADDGIISASTADQTQQPAFDFLWSQATGNYSAPAVNFIFTHRMSKINIAFTNGNDVDLSDLTFSIDGLVLDGTFDTATGEAKAAEYGSAASLTAALSTDSKASLIVFPQSADKLTVTATTEGQQYSCALSPGAFASGNAYTFNIVVKKTGMTVTGSTITDWTAGGEFNGEATMPPAKVGDYFYSDGTYSTALDASKTCIGIVFHIGHHENDGSDYSSTGIGRTQCHGYVVALQDAAIDRCMWGVYGTEIGCIPTDANGDKQDNRNNPDIDWNGYAWTQKIIAAAGGKDKLNATEQAGYPATWYAVVSYEAGCNAPSKSSGWFLPSIGQFWKIYQDRSSLLGSVSGAGLKSNWYVSSSEYYDSPAEDALYVNVYSGNVNLGSKDNRMNCEVRPVLAF